MNKVLKFIGILLLLCLLFLPVALSVWLRQTPWPGIFLTTASIGILLLCLIIRALWLRFVARKTDDGIIMRQKKDAGAAGSPSADNSIGLLWKNAVKKIKKSHLRQYGNPMYVLPWYLVMGAKGSGKSSLVSQSGLTPGFPDTNTGAATGDNAACGFEFFEEAVLMDTDGRFVSGTAKTDTQHWYQFLSCLVKYRKKEPVRGVIITISAETLKADSANSGTKTPAEQGRELRQRLDDIMRYTGMRVPVYFLVTHCDRIFGMKEFCEFLSNSAIDGVFGAENRDHTINPLDFVDGLFKKCRKKMQALQHHIANWNTNEAVFSKLFLFPEEFTGMQQGLETIIEESMGATVYKEQPLLKGVFFVSACQKGQPRSVIKEKLGFASDPTPETETPNPMFLKAFFKNVLPLSGKSSAPTRNAMQWKKRILFVTLATWLLAVIAVGGFLSLSFAVSYSTMETVKKTYATAPVLSDNVLTSVNQLDDLKKTAMMVAQKNQSRWIPDFGLEHSANMEAYLKAMFCSTFSKTFLKRYDQALFDKTLLFSNKTSPVFVASTVLHLTRRINLMDQYLASQGSAADNSSLPGPDFFHISSQTQNGFIPGLNDRLTDQFKTWLTWADDTAVMAEKQVLLNHLHHILDEKNFNYQWLLAWCDAQADLDPIKLEDFWKGSRHLDNELAVPSAYTVAGWKKITQIFSELERAISDPLTIAKKKKTFIQKYQTDYLNEWHFFAKGFASGEKKLTGTEEKLATALRIADNRGPYARFITCLTEQVQPVFSWETAPPLWVKGVVELAGIQAEARALKEQAKDNQAGKVAKKGLKFLGGISKKIAQTALNNADVNQDPEKLMKGAMAWNSYCEGIKAMAGAVVSGKAAFSLASEAFDEDPAKGASSVYQAASSVTTLTLSMMNYRASQKTVAGLIRGPFDFLWQFICDRSACHLQSLWEASVMAEIDGVHDIKMINELMQGKQGFVPAFITGDAKPFIWRNSRKGYFAKTVHGCQIPFQKPFFTYLTRAAYSKVSEKGSYSVGLKGLPTDVNSDATMIPHTTKLELTCAEGLQTLVNKNYPTQKTFDWSPGQCGDVVLKIYIGHLVLSKTYSGFRPFAIFLKAFATGQHTFYRSDFPEQAAALKRMQIKYIKVKYKVTGAKPVISLLKMSAGNAPGNIVWCKK